MLAKKVLFTGRVQGVGFRMTTFIIAQRYQVVGFVANLPDGRVELEVGGETEEVSRFLEELRMKMSDNIDSVESSELAGVNGSSFEIRG